MSRNQASFILNLIDRVSGPIRNIVSQGAVLQRTFNSSATSINSLNQKLQQLTFTRNASTSITAIRQLNGEIAATARQIQRMENLPPRSFFNNILSARSAIGSMAAAGAAFFSLSAIGGGISKLFSIGSEREQAKIAMEGLIGDVGLANKKIAEMQKFADVSPFETAEVIGAGKQLLAAGVGVDALMGKMNALGDVASGSGKDFNELANIYAKMTAKGKVQTETLNMMLDAGIPIRRELEKITGKSGMAFDKMVESGLDIKLIDQAIAQMTGSTGIYFDAMRKQSESTRGLFSTMVSGFENLSVKIFVKIQPFINKLIELGTRALPYIESGFRKVLEVTRFVRDVFMSIYGFVSENAFAFTALGVAVAGIAIQLGVAALIANWSAISFGIMYYSVVAATWVSNLFTTAMRFLNMVLFQNPIGLVILGVTALAAGFIYAWNHSEKFRGAIMGVWGVMKQFFESTIKPGIELLKALGNILHGVWKMMTGNFASGFEMIKDNVVKAGKEFVNIHKSVLPSKENVLKYKVAFDSGFADGVKDFNTGKKLDIMASVGKQTGGQASSEKDKSTPAGLPGSTSNILSGNPTNISADKSVGRIVNMRIDKIEVKAIMNNVTEGLKNIEDQVAQVIVGAVRDAEVILSNG